MSIRPGSMWLLPSLTRGPRKIEDLLGLSQLFHQAPTIEVALALVAELVQQRPRHRETTSGLALVAWHLARQVLVDGSSEVGQRRFHDAADELQPVVDRVLCAGGPAVGQHVAADLAKRGLEEQKADVARFSAGGRPQAVDRPVQDLEPLLEIGKRGME